MRILQLIDSLDAGGAERMAVHYANGLAERIECSALVATRKEGVLKDTLQNEVDYLFLNRKQTFDLGAIWRLRRFVKSNKIELIHAHATSIFTAVLLKLITPQVKILWHDHYGNSDYLAKRPSAALKLMSFLLIGIISVNKALEKWATAHLSVKNILYLPNFSPQPQWQEVVTIIRGTEGKRIVCLANLREQKNHMLLVDVASELKKTHPDWTFHLVGKDFGDLYSKTIQQRIKELGLETQVFIYGTCPDTSEILRQMDIGILTSNSEGLPLALLEYGNHKLPCLVTAVGELPTIIENGVNGFSVIRGDQSALLKHLKLLVESASLRSTLGTNLEKTVGDQFSRDAVLEQYLKWIKNAV